MPKTNRKRRKTARRLTLSLFAVIVATAAASPVLAANDIIEIDTGAAALVAAFAVLMAGIIFEVWRFTNGPLSSASTNTDKDLHQGMHE